MNVSLSKCFSNNLLQKVDKPFSIQTWVENIDWTHQQWWPAQCCEYCPSWVLAARIRVCSCVVLPVAAITVDLAWLLSFTLEDLSSNKHFQENHIWNTAVYYVAPHLISSIDDVVKFPHQWLLLWDEVVKNYKQLKAIHKKTLCLSQLSLLCWYHMSSSYYPVRKYEHSAAFIFFKHYIYSDEVATRMLPRSGSHIFSQNFHIVT